MRTRRDGTRKVEKEGLESGVVSLAERDPKVLRKVVYSTLTGIDVYCQRLKGIVSRLDKC